MNRHTISKLGTVTIMGLALLPCSAVSQQKSLKDQLIGAWMVVSIDNVLPDGRKQQLYGANPKGILVLDVSGRFSQVQMSGDRPKFKSANRLQATAEESQAAMHTSLAQFGTWSVSEPDKTLILRVEGALIPNAEGTETKRLIDSITADEVKYTNTGTAVGGKNELVYRRAK